MGGFAGRVRTRQTLLVWVAHLLLATDASTEVLSLRTVPHICSSRSTRVTAGPSSKNSATGGSAKRLLQCCVEILQHQPLFHEDKKWQGITVLCENLYPRHAETTLWPPFAQFGTQQHQRRPELRLFHRPYHTDWAPQLGKRCASQNCQQLKFFSNFTWGDEWCRFRIIGGPNMI